MKANSSFFKALFYLTLLLNLVFVLQIFSVLSDAELNTFFNSDGLYLPSIYKDIFIDNTGFAGWHLNAAPNFFPEWPVYFLVRFITGDFKIAAVIYSVLYVLAVNLLTVLIIKKVFKKIEYSYLILVNIGFAVFLHQYILLNDFIETSFLFFTGFHGGAYFMALLSLLMLVFYLQQGRKIHYILLIVFIVLGVLSDRLLIMYFVVPSLTSLLFIRNPDFRRRIIKSSTASVLATVAGMVIYNLIKHSDYIYIIGLGNKKFDITKIGSAFNHYTIVLNRLIDAGGVELIIVVVFFISIIAGILVSLFAVFGKGKNFNSLFEKILVVFFTAYIIIVALTPIIHGTFLGLGHLRYNFSSFYVAMSFFVVLLWLLKRIKPVTGSFVSVLALVLGFAAVFSAIRNETNNNTVKGLKDVSNYYPDDVERIDELAEQYNLKYGVGNYWFAKKTTMFSKNNVRIYTVVDDLRPWFHVTNENWYLQNGKGKYSNPAFSFVLLNTLNPRGDFYEKLKEESDTLTNGNIKVLKVPAFGFNEKKQGYLINENNPDQ